jgi:hypothetical protein
LAGVDPPALVATELGAKFGAVPAFLSRVPRLFARALRLRCPNCGRGRLFTSWLRMRSRCPVCGLELERGEEGYQVGSYMFNIFFPFSKTLFLAFDLLFRPDAREAR